MAEKLFIIKKYVRAKSASEAIRKEKKIAVDDVWVDEDWRKSATDKLADQMGFTIEHDKG